MKYNTSYYLYPTFNSGYTVNSWTKTSSTGTLSSTTAANPYFTMGLGDGAVTLTGKSNYTGYYIQDFTRSLCSSLASSGNYSVRDRRDNNDYTVRYINGNCWMTQNLRITGTVSATNSNFTGSSVTLNDGAVSNSSIPYAYNHGDTTYGVLYNFCAASAQRNNGCSEASAYYGSSDLCPSGWRLPTLSETSTLSSYQTQFNVARAGIYQGELMNVGEGGYWWTATPTNSFCQAYCQNDFGIYNTYWFVGVESNMNISSMESVRCIRSS